MLNLESVLGQIRMPARTAHIDSFPMGIQYKKFNEAEKDEKVVAQLENLKNKLGGQKLVLSVDRLDYSKGILHRLRAFDALLEKHPEWRGKVSLVMVAVPSREGVGSYQNLKEQVDKEVGCINGKHATLEWSPVHYFYRSVPFETLSALYQLCDVGLVTPLRDGMNLVAKEYVASRRDQSGVLILSEMAGASFELTEALKINPHHQEEIVDALIQALEMPLENQKERMRKMQKQLRQNTVEKWAERFLERLQDIKRKEDGHAKNVLNGHEVRRIATTYQNAQKPLLVLDYDGTLVSFHDEPDQALPEKETKEILARLAEQATVAIVSGRDHFSLDEWLGDLPVELVAEHGQWQKTNGEWEKETEVGTLWKKEVQKVLREFTSKTPGAFIERKVSSLAFHYRKSDNFLTEMRVPQLTEALMPVCVKHQLELLHGNKVLEIRLAGINKGTAVQKLLEKHSADFILCIGDDRTDEDMFKVLPPEAFTIKVGEGDTAARYRLRNTGQVKGLLKVLLDDLIVKSSEVPAEFAMAD